MTHIGTPAEQLEGRLLFICTKSDFGSEKDFTDLTALLEDAKFERDTEALSTAQRILRGVYYRQMHVVEETTEQAHNRGRIAQMIDEIDRVLLWLAAEQPLEVDWQGRAGELLLGIVRLQPTASFYGLARRMHDRDELVEQALTALEEGGLMVKRQVEGRTYYFLTRRGWYSFMEMELKKFEEQDPDRA